ncbi:UNVERIFIED_ORG: hypothetical protein BDK47_11682 [Anoxybacillus amylolyticus]
MKKWYIDRVFVNQGKLYDRGFVLVEDGEEAWIEWTSPHTRTTDTFKIDECFYEDGTPILREDGELLGSLKAKTYFLWTWSRLRKYEEYRIIDPDETEKVIPTENCILFETPLTEAQKETIRRILQEYEGRLVSLDEDEIRTLLQKDESVKNIPFRKTDEYEPVETVNQYELFELEEKGFLLTSLMDSVYLYTWWDGSNWIREILHPDDLVEVVVDQERKINLDEWDGRNWSTGGLGKHENVHLVCSVDGREEKDTFLVWRYSQWQGEHDTAILLFSIQELESYLKEIGRDAYKYIKELYGN